MLQSLMFQTCFYIINTEQRFNTYAYILDRFENSLYEM